MQSDDYRSLDYRCFIKLTKQRNQRTKHFLLHGLNPFCLKQYENKTQNSNEIEYMAHYDKYGEINDTLWLSRQCYHVTDPCECCHVMKIDQSDKIKQDHIYMANGKISPCLKWVQTTESRVQNLHLTFWMGLLIMILMGLQIKRVFWPQFRDNFC